jgi:hypothetical protein
MDPRDLYGLPLERFTEERNALAGELRRAGRRDDAAAVAKLRKPSVAAWAVNQLVRTQQRGTAAVFAAGDALRQAQSDLLAERADPGALRRAITQERAAVERLTEIARGLLSSSGQELSPARLEQVSETLHAAALDDDARAKVQDGCLERELRHVGLGALGAGGTEGTSRPQPATAKRPRSGKAEARRGDESAARRLEAEARRRAERAARELAAAQARRERAAEALRGAEQALAQARKLAAEAASEHERAKQALERL